jgi:CTP:molybdopterin cytidylyltransferase MocA
MRVAAIVLAAGAGRRFGGPKALARLGTRTFLEAATSLFARDDVAARIVVLGAEAERVGREVQLAEGTAIVVNPLHAEGMLTSVWAGLDAAEALGVDAVLLHPVDNPVAEPATIAAVLSALAEGAVIAVPSHGGRRGHPAGFARPAWTALREAPLAAGARALLLARPDWVVHVDAGPDCLVDVDTPAALAALQGGGSRAR